MINAIRVVYKLISFLILFILTGTFLIYIEEITLNQHSYINESLFALLHSLKNFSLLG